MQDIANSLRDIHLPMMPSTYILSPLAWTSCIALFAISIGMLLYYRKKTAFKREALLELSRLEACFNEGGPIAHQALVQCNMLLRQVCLHCYAKERTNFAGLTAKAWVAYLNQKATKNPLAPPLFHPSMIEIFDRVIYNGPDHPLPNNAGDVLVVSRRWIQAQPWRQR